MPSRAPAAASGLTLVLPCGCTMTVDRSIGVAHDTPAVDNPAGVVFFGPDRSRQPGGIESAFPGGRPRRRNFMNVKAHDSGSPRNHRHAGAWSDRLRRHRGRGRTGPAPGSGLTGACNMLVALSTDESSSLMTAFAEENINGWNGKWTGVAASGCDLQQP